MLKEKDEIPSLEHLDSKINQMKSKLEPALPEKPRGVAAAMQMGVELLAGALVGGVSGFYLDKWLGTSPFLFILCFFLGCAGGFMTLQRSMRSDETQTKDN